MSYNFIFFGSDEFSIIVLKKLIDSNYRPTLCITQPDKPKGRKLILTPTPLKEFCIENNIKVIEPEILSAEQINSNITNNSIDFFVIASYGKIISQEVLDIPKEGCLNVHPSLLPQYRGASPIETSILNDTKNTGVTIMLMDAKMDHGPILLQKEHTFEKWPTSKKEVHDFLANLGGEMLVETIKPFMEKQIQSREQDHSKATFTKMIKKENGQIDISDKDYKTYLKYVAFTPWPGIFFFINKQDKQIRVKIESAHFDNTEGFIIDNVIPEGKNLMSWESFKNGYLK